MQMKTFAWGSLGMVAALALGAGGCELIAAVDHDLIPQGGGNAGGGNTGGAGGGTTTTTGGGGMGGSGGGGCIPENCADPGNDCLQKACDGDMCGTPTPLASGQACNSAPGEGGGGTMAGVCDGAGQCVECVGNEQCTAPDTCDLDTNECVPPHCMNGTEDADETDIDCGGADCGPCMNTQGCMVPGDCTSGYCNAMVCTACTGTGAGQCAGTEYCDNGVCTDKVANGTSCSDDAACTSGNCVTTSAGDLCCDTACTGGCQACALADTGSANGTCANVTAGMDPKNFCPAADCDATACNGNGACNDVTAGTNCGSGPMCTGSSLNPQDTCDALGVCQAGMAAACPNDLVCENTTACFATCTAHANCVMGFFCGQVGGAGGNAGECTAKLTDGQACAVNEECISNNCAALVCAP